jgi:hypothetical protein
MYLVNINGQDFELEHDGGDDDHAPTWTWVKSIPDCPACNEPLSHGRSGRLAAMHHVWAFESKVECGHCGWQSALVRS